MSHTTHKVLIVEDDEPVRKALFIKLTEEGFTVLEAKNGQQGLDIALKEKPDFILLDIIMPVMDGITMLHNLRADEHGKDVPVAILTNLTDDKRLLDSHKENVYDYLVKTDWKLQDVVELVRNKLQK